MLAQVGSKELEVLQAELRSLAKSLMETYEALSMGLHNLSDEWRDEKFEEFENSFHSRQEIIRELSESYEKFATEYIAQRIDIIKEAENRRASK